MSGVNDIRTAFLEYFEKNNHQSVSSSGLVPQNDPSLMFTNAGMVPFKDVFTGLETRPYARATSSQKCLRAGGKHNDLDNVGFTVRHHTFFEMLGNFSFGDYFKHEAIELAWNLITNTFDLPVERLLVTVFADDEQAYQFWKKIAGLPDEKIVKIATVDNFWSMGDTGPCGPCSEIFYDHGEHVAGGPPGSPDEDGDRFIEIWNLVFMQYDRLEDGTQIDLPKPSIDTGMGLERIAAVLQGTHDNFETDLFKALIASAAAATGSDIEGPGQKSLRVIADHLRAMSFLISEGVLPSNEGRGYVLRRIMRRAMRHANMLGATDPSLFKIVPTLVSEMGHAFPDLMRGESLVTETIRAEEERFLTTLSRGLKILEDETNTLGSGDTLSGDMAFKLYDTYGFPLDLTEDALKVRGIGVDQTGFDKAMARQKQEARKNWSGSGDSKTDRIWLDLSQQLSPTEFLGYEASQTQGQLRAIIVDGTPTDSLDQNTKASLIFNQTPFYAESGGQVGDTGVIATANMRFKVEDTQKRGDGLFVHMGRLVDGSLHVGDVATLTIDLANRQAIRANHSATHLLHAALHKVLGDHAVQKGSQVSVERLRFDFANAHAVSGAQLCQIEDIANHFVLQDSAVETRLMGIKEAIDAGAMALFGEKYADEVRVVSMGNLPENVPQHENGEVYSKELCGGTHVTRTGEIGLITLTHETAVASGVRRIEALTGSRARSYLNAQNARLKKIAAGLKTTPEDAADKITILMDERKNLEREVSQLRRQMVMGQKGATDTDDIEQIKGINYLAKSIPGLPLKELRGLVDQGKKQVGTGIVVVVGVAEEGKAGIAVGVSDDLVERFNAIDLVRIGAHILGGKGGGGRPDMAQAGGPDGTKADEAVRSIRDAIHANAHG